MPSHETITDPNIHEPKGVSSATEGMVYVSDGAGSGAWTNWPFGKAFYQHSTTGQVINTTPSRLAINGLGILTRTGNLPREIRGTAELWDDTVYKILPIKLNDGYQVRVDIPITAETGSPTELQIQFDISGATSPTTVILEKFYPTGKSVPYTISFDTSLDILTNATLTGGIQFFLSTDTGSVTLGSPGILIHKISDGDL